MSSEAAVAPSCEGGTPRPPRPQAPSPLARARALAPQIAAAADDIDRERELPEALVEAMVSAGMFRLLVPRAIGGEEMDWLEYLDVVRTIAEADGSVGWCLNQGAVFATTSACCSEPLAREVWGDPRTVVGNGPPKGCTSVPTDGGYLLSGRWMFSSGCRHANWIAALTVEDGVRLHMLPHDEVTFVDVWQVQGLRGTGSFAFETDGLFVPERRVMHNYGSQREPGPLYVVPQHLLFACGFGCVALGVARAGLDATIALADDKRPRFVKRPISESEVVQHQIGKAEATWRAAKALLHETVGNVWESVRATGEITVEQRIHLRMAGTHAIRQSMEAVDIAYNLSGADAIFASKAIQRRFQDAHVITQQVQG
ncbi:MAG: hypothetical protein F4X99_22135, partial [Gammaproteobacteria bacterium]|nr:hypothetical protein [Gammaproteobacteria bacterium]